MSNKADLYWNDYKYFPYEKELALKEITKILKTPTINIDNRSIHVEGNFEKKDLDKLVYFGGYKFNGHQEPTLQFLLESSCSISGKKNKQSTRYSVHGIHEYKGKFNPQIVSGIFNILGIKENSKILDPFCGSGTTLVEGTHRNINANGWDINPFAIYMTNAKIQALTVSAETLKKSLEKIIKAYENNHTNQKNEKQNEREIYLNKWFTRAFFNDFEKLRICIIENSYDVQNVFLALASNLLREYSFQEPLDLRIRRRKSPLPDEPIISRYIANTGKFINNLSNAQGVLGVKETTNIAYLFDSRSAKIKSSNWNVRPLYHAAITSPPYATALPYIDTQRLSLVWLNLISPLEIRALEAKLTGSREFIKTQERMWKNALHENKSKLPSIIHNYCIDLEKSLSENDGFRRKAKPFLVYRYFSDMQLSFHSVKKVIRKNGFYTLVVGNNKTTLGGKTFYIDTPHMLAKLAENTGWKLQETIQLQAYQRYNMHSKNSINNESLLILRKK